MGYVGNQQAEGFVQRPTKQDLTGATGTSLTLTHAVSKEEDIDLYINNVKQEPTTAYTVAGTAVTLTGSVVASDDIYVVYNGLALQTTVPPDGSVTSAKLVYPLTTFSSTGIDDNATSTAMTLDSSGNVGIGTSSPSQKLTVDGAGTAARIEVRNTSDSNRGGYLRDTGSAFEIGTNSGVRPLAFAYDNSEKMRIDTSGNLLVGRTSVNHFGTLVLDYTGLTKRGIVLQTTDSDSAGAVAFANTSNALVGTITVTASSTAYNTSSDYRLKENVTDITGATERLKQLNPVRFNFIADADTTVDGFLAHEVQSVVPEAITGTHNEVDDDGNPVYQGIDQSKLVPLLVKTIQELEARIAALESA